MNELPRMRVLNKHTATPNQRRQAVNIMRGTPFGNKYEIGKDGNREVVLTKYQHWLCDRIDHNNLFHDQVRNLLGRDLLCCCSPKPCHGLLLRSACYMLNGLTTKASVWPKPKELGLEDDFACQDCGCHHTMYMLRNPIWSLIASKKEILCFSCAETRLGRRIERDDLKICPVNATLLLLIDRVPASVAFVP